MALPHAVQPSTHAPLADPSIRRALLHQVRRVVPEREAEDVVQETLADALASKALPSERGRLICFLRAIARNKAVDFHRRACREDASPPPEQSAPADDGSAPDLLRWARSQLPGTAGAIDTLRWMLRESDGETLESIAHEANLPPETVRQRVTRLRRFLRERWLLELSAAAALLTLALLLLLSSRRPAPEAVHREIIEPRDPPSAPRSPAPRDAAPERAFALERCAAGDHDACLRGLDRARSLDPEGDSAPDVQAARRRAEEALRPTPPSPSASSPQAPRKPPQGGAMKMQGDTAVEARSRCLCVKGDPLCSCF